MFFKVFKIVKFKVFCVFNKYNYIIGNNYIVELEISKNINIEVVNYYYNFHIIG